MKKDLRKCALEAAALRNLQFQTRDHWLHNLKVRQKIASLYITQFSTQPVAQANAPLQAQSQELV